MRVTPACYSKCVSFAQGTGGGAVQANSGGAVAARLPRLASSEPARPAVGQARQLFVARGGGASRRCGAQQIQPTAVVAAPFSRLSQCGAADPICAVSGAP